VKRLCLFRHDPDHDDALLEQILAASRMLVGHRKNALDCVMAAEGLTILVKQKE
jgi:hypothetical protein